MKLNKRAIYIIILLTAFSLAGIIIVQAIWINNSVKVKEDDFRRNVTAVLNKIALKIDHYNNMSFINNTPSNIINIDSLKAIIKNQVSRNDSNYHIRLTPGDSASTINNRIETINTPSGNPIEKHTTTINTNTGTNDTAIIQIEEYIDKKANSINQTITQMVVEMRHEFSNVSPEKKYQYYNEIIKKELQNAGIEIPYEYAISNRYNIIFQSPEYQQTSKESGAFRVTLSADFFQRPLELLWLSFPNTKNFLYKSMLGLLLASLIFTLLISSVFYIVIRTVIKQKKIADIKNDFINNMTHEFKTPIATINLAADSIKNPTTLADTASITHFVDVIKEQNKRLNNQVEHVLQLSLLEKDKLKIVADNYSGNDLGQIAIENIRLRVEQKGGRITANFNAEKDLINVDELHFLNVLNNLLDNALKYSEDVVLIDVETDNDNEYFYIHIGDSGPGISKDSQKHIFEKFYRVHTGNVHNVKGFGLGLSYVKTMTELFKGQISVKSELGKGAIFTIKLPLQ